MCWLTAIWHPGRVRRVGARRLRFKTMRSPQIWAKKGCYLFADKLLYVQGGDGYFCTRNDEFGLGRHRFSTIANMEAEQVGNIVKRDVRLAEVSKYSFLEIVRFGLNMLGQRKEVPQPSVLFQLSRHLITIPLRRVLNSTRHLQSDVVVWLFSTLSIGPCKPFDARRIH